MNKDLLDMAIRNLVIHDVYLHSSTVKLKDGFLPLFYKDPVVIQFKNQILDSLMYEMNDHKDFKSLVVYQYETGFRVIPDGLSDEIMSNEELLKEEALAEVNAIFNASYLVKDDTKDEAIKEFGITNVDFNVWPYWREYASSVATRLRLPHFIVPLRSPSIAQKSD